MSTPTMRAALERLVELDDAASALGADPDMTAWDDAIAAASAALKAEPVKEGPSERIVSIAKAVQECAFAHESDARLIGNVCAEDVADLCDALIDRWAHPATPAAPEAGEGPSAADLLPVEPPNLPTTMAMQYRSAWREGVEDGWNEARSILARWARPAAPPAIVTLPLHAANVACRPTAGGPGQLNPPPPAPGMRREWLWSPSQMAECGGPCWAAQDPRRCDCGALWRDVPATPTKPQPHGGRQLPNLP